MSRARSISLSILGLAAMGALHAACGADPVQDPSYLLVELVPAISAMQKPAAAQVVVHSGDEIVATFCVNIDGAAGETAASFVLKREADKPADARITVEVTAYQALSGQSNAAVGKEFVCPGALPPALTPVQAVELDFCASQTRHLVFHVGADCGCSGDLDGGMDDAGMGDAGMGDGGAASDAGDAGDMGDAGDGDAGPPPCGCAAGFACGVGLSTSGQTCGPTACCTASISSACALDS